MNGMEQAILLVYLQQLDSCTTLTKQLERKLDGNYIEGAVLNKSWE